MSSNRSEEAQQAIESLLMDFVKTTRKITGHNPRLTPEDHFKDRLSSPAVTRNISTTEIEWVPKPHHDFNLFVDLEKGLEITIHDDLKAYYGAYWSEGICCQSEQGLVKLIQIWNQTDLEMLRENLLGHAFMKLKKKQALTLFFGLGEGDNILTMDNANGHIYMEVPGRRPHRQLAENIADYLRTLRVTLQSYGSN